MFNVHNKCLFSLELLFFYTQFLFYLRSASHVMVEYYVFKLTSRCMKTEIVSKVREADGLRYTGLEFRCLYVYNTT